MKRSTIKFSHCYRKLQDQGDEAQLLQVLEVNLKNLSRPFLNYDTDEGLFKLPKSGAYMMLIFLGKRGLFTTLRPCFPTAKLEWYKSKIGKLFDIKIEPQFKL